LVEDDPMLLATTQSVLADAGYRVVSCSSPVHAIELCRKWPHARVLLTKMAFRESPLTGIQLAERVMRLCRCTAILTETFDPALLQTVRGFDEYAFLPQPFTPAQLLAAVAEAWSAAGSGPLRRATAPHEPPPDDPTGLFGAGRLFRRPEPAPIRC
jgi:CheY-like chemotaxis protein